jgi:hypothetical protein
VSQGVEPGVYRVGEFAVAVDRDAGFALSVRDRSDPGRVLWSSLPGGELRATAEGEETVRESSGHFFIEDEYRETTSGPDDRFGRAKSEIAWSEGAGSLAAATGGEGYRFSFFAATAELCALGWRWRKPPFDRVYITYAFSPDERFFGFGEAVHVLQT